MAEGHMYSIALFHVVSRAYGGVDVLNCKSQRPPQQAVSESFFKRTKDENSKPPAVMGGGDGVQTNRKSFLPLQFVV